MTRSVALKAASVQVARISRGPVGYPGASLSLFEVTYLARHCVAGTMDCDAILLMAKARGTRKLAFARVLAVHLVHIIAGRTHEDVARSFQRNRSTASHHFETIEDLRDVREFDAFMALLERKYELLLEMHALRAGKAWQRALRAIETAVVTGELEGQAARSAEYVAETFRRDAP